MIKLVLDSELYEITEEHNERLQAVIGTCCGSCNEWTLQDVRAVCLSIKDRYNPIACEFHETPSEQFDKQGQPIKDGGLPF